MAQIDIELRIHELYRTYGPSKRMGVGHGDLTRPHYFLHRNFLGEQDLAIVFNTKRCRFQCKFCALPAKSSKRWVDHEQVLAQFDHVITEVRHSLGILDRVTLSNEGSVLDEGTFPPDTVVAIARAVRRLPRISKLVFETRLGFARADKLRELQEISGKKLVLLTGFETRDPRIREQILGKRESLEDVQTGLDTVAATGCHLAAYVLYKPSPRMTDEEAAIEAEESIDYVAESCERRSIPFVIRINPMYVATGTPWAQLAERVDYQPPRLSDIMALAEKKRAHGMSIYLGLDTEGLSDPSGTYRGREDFSSALLKQAILQNTPCGGSVQKG